MFDPSVSSIVVDLLLEAADGRSSLVIPVVLDTGASLTILATDIMARLGYDPANPDLERQRIVTGAASNMRLVQHCVPPPPSAKKSPTSMFCATTCRPRAASMNFSDSIFSDNSSSQSVFAKASLISTANAESLSQFHHVKILAGPHRITLSALASTFGGIVRPICFAAFKLMISSTFFGCSMGISPGLAPFRILST